MDRVNIYTYTDIRGPGRRTGYYVYLLEQETAKGPATLHKIEKAAERETENKVQLLAVIGALKRLRKNCDLEIHTHSEYVSAGFTKGCKVGGKRLAERKREAGGEPGGMGGNGGITECA